MDEYIFLLINEKHVKGTSHIKYSSDFINKIYWVVKVSYETFDRLSWNCQ